MKKLLALLFAVLGLCACVPTATPTPLPPTPDARATETQIAARIFATLTASVPTPTRTNTPTQTSTPLVTDAVLARDFKSDTGTPVDVTTEYDPGQKKFHLAVTVKDVPQQTRFKSVWMAVDIGGTTPPNTTIEENELVVTGSGTFEFTIAPKTGQWSSGKYKVDLYVNNQLDRTLNFTVRALTPTRVLSPTRSLTATRTPIPSATLKASATPIPTRGYSAAETQYLADVGSIASDYSDLGTQYLDLLKAARNNPTLILYTNCLDSQWCIEMATVLAGFRACNNRIRELNSPQLFASVHLDLLDAASHTDSFVDLLASGLDEKDLNMINLSNQELTLATAAFQRATDKIKKITGQ